MCVGSFSETTFINKTFECLCEIHTTGDWNEGGQASLEYFIINSFGWATETSSALFQLIVICLMILKQKELWLHKNWLMKSRLRANDIFVEESCPNS